MFDRRGLKVSTDSMQQENAHPQLRLASRVCRLIILLKLWGHKSV